MLLYIFDECPNDIMLKKIVFVSSIIAQLKLFTHYSFSSICGSVIYEDDHFAIVNKPEGIVVFSHKNGGFGRQNVNSCLPWVLTPPRPGIVSVMRRPAPVHRIDRGTSGLSVGPVIRKGI